MCVCVCVCVCVWTGLYYPVGEININSTLVNPSKWLYYVRN